MYQLLGLSTKTQLTMKDRIKELEEQLAKAREEEDNKALEKYQYLIGKCLHKAATSYQKITGINWVNLRVNNSGDVDEICYDCIDIYCNIKGALPNARIDTDESYEIYSNNIDDYIISEEVFNKALNECIEVIKNKCNENN